jgi:phosphatidate cytidylyltransferase
MSTGEGTELPHWADPPTGEVPAALAGPDNGDDLQAWRLLGSRGLHWRDDVNGWANAPGVEDLVDEVAGPIPAEDDRADPFSFDEDFDRLERQRTQRVPQAPPAGATGGALASGAGTSGDVEGPAEDLRLDVFPPTLSAQRETERQQAAERLAGQHRSPSAQFGGPAPSQGPSTGQLGSRGQLGQHGRRAPYDLNAGSAGAPGGRSVGAAVATGTVLIAVFVVCYLIGPLALLALAALGVVGCAFEAYAMFQEAGFRPATLLGVAGSAGAVLAAYWKGPAAVPIVVAVVLVGSFIWYLARVVEARPVVNAAVTFLVFAWVGMLGSFAGLLLEAHKGNHLFFGAVIPTVLADAAAWFAGSSVGSHPLAPHVSPAKTWEGVIAGAVVAVVAGALIGHELSPWGGLRHGVELGVLVAVVAPVGDLVQSMVKRDLKLKDSGSLLPGHGGLLDRFDSLLFVLPAVYFLAVALHLAH